MDVNVDHFIMWPSCLLHSWRRGTPCPSPLGRQSSAGHQRSGPAGHLPDPPGFHRSLGWQMRRDELASTQIRVICHPLLKQILFALQ